MHILITRHRYKLFPWWAKLLSWIGALALILLLARLLLLFLRRK